MKANLRCAAIMLVLNLWAAPLLANCRQALVIALDVSSSVDAKEYSLQMQGLAGALLDAEVQALLLSQPQTPVNLAVFEWSGRHDQRVIIQWTALKTSADLIAIAGILARQPRPVGTRPTANGHALSFAVQLLDQAPECWEQTVDISGDGKNNDGYRPQVAKRGAGFAQTTVNGLVIGTDSPPYQVSEDEIAELSSYYRHEVIHGADAFIEIALGFEDFEAAMKRKLLRELSLAVAWKD